MSKMGKVVLQLEDGSEINLADLLKFGSDSMTPVDLQSRYAKMIQTHNAVSVATASSSMGTAWYETTGFDKLALTMTNSTATASYVDVFWSNDGISIHGANYSVLSSTALTKAIELAVCAKYVKIQLANQHTSATTMSAWIHLKV